jgi:hypothetical protein
MTMMSSAIGRPERTPPRGKSLFALAAAVTRHCGYYIPRSAYTLLTRAQPPCRPLCHRGNLLAHALPTLILSPPTVSRSLSSLAFHARTLFLFLFTCSFHTVCLSLKFVRACMRDGVVKQTIDHHVVVVPFKTDTYIYIYLILRVDRVCVCHLRPSYEDARACERMCTINCRGLQNRKVQSSF